MVNRDGSLMPTVSRIFKAGKLNVVDIDTAGEAMDVDDKVLLRRYSPSGAIRCQ
jgi:hypothetical protein